MLKEKNRIMQIEEKTKVRNQGEISLITTIPKTYVKALNIESGDVLEWTLNTETEKLELKIINHDNLTDEENSQFKKNNQ